MGLSVLLVCVGCMLPAVGALLILMSIPITSWDASWDEIKKAGSIMFHKRKFQVGLVCLVIGLLIILYIL